MTHRKRTTLTSIAYKRCSEVGMYLYIYRPTVNTEMINTPPEDRTHIHRVQTVPVGEDRHAVDTVGVLSGLGTRTLRWGTIERSYFLSTGSQRDCNGPYRPAKHRQTRTHTHVHTHTHTHARTHARTHTLTHTHTHLSLIHI